jgi:hypothetical protein
VAINNLQKLNIQKKANSFGISLFDLVSGDGNRLTNY